MVNKNKAPTILPDAKVNSALLRAGRHLAPNTSAGVLAAQQALLPRKAVLKVDATIPVLAADDFGSVKLCDMPTGQVYILGARANLIASGTGTGFALANVDVAVGSAAASNATLATTMLDVLAKIDAVTVTGVVQGASATPVALNGATPDLFLNVAVALSGNGSVRLVGTIEITYLDLGDPAA